MQPTPPDGAAAADPTVPSAPSDASAAPPDATPVTSEAPPTAATEGSGDQGSEEVTPAPSAATLEEPASEPGAPPPVSTEPVTSDAPAEGDQPGVAAAEAKEEPAAEPGTSPGRKGSAGSLSPWEKASATFKLTISGGKDQEMAGKLISNLAGDVDVRELIDDLEEDEKELRKKLRSVIPKVKITLPRLDPNLFGPPMDPKKMFLQAVAFIAALPEHVETAQAKVDEYKAKAQTEYEKVKPHVDKAHQTVKPLLDKGHELAKPHIDATKVACTPYCESLQQVVKMIGLTIVSAFLACVMAILNKIFNAPGGDKLKEKFDWTVAKTGELTEQAKTKLPAALAWLKEFVLVTLPAFIKKIPYYVQHMDESIQKMAAMAAGWYAGAKAFALAFAPCVPTKARKYVGLPEEDIEAGTGATPAAAPTATDGARAEKRSKAKNKQKARLEAQAKKKADADAALAAKMPASAPPTPKDLLPTAVASATSIVTAWVAYSMACAQAAAADAMAAAEAAATDAQSAVESYERRQLVSLPAGLALPAAVANLTAGLALPSPLPSVDEMSDFAEETIAEVTDSVAEVTDSVESEIAEISSQIPTDLASAKAAAKAFAPNATALALAAAMASPAGGAIAAVAAIKTDYGPLVVACIAAVLNTASVAYTWYMAAGNLFGMVQAAKAEANAELVTMLDAAQGKVEVPLAELDDVVDQALSSQEPALSKIDKLGSLLKSINPKLEVPSSKMLTGPTEEGLKQVGEVFTKLKVKMPAEAEAKMKSTLLGAILLDRQAFDVAVVGVPMLSLLAFNLYVATSGDYTVASSSSRRMLQEEVEGPSFGAYFGPVFTQIELAVLQAGLAYLLSQKRYLAILLNMGVGLLEAQLSSYANRQIQRRVDRIIGGAFNALTEAADNFFPKMLNALEVLAQALGQADPDDMKAMKARAAKDDAKGKQLAVYSTNRKDDKKGPACGCEVM